MPTSAASALVRAGALGLLAGLGLAAVVLLGKAALRLRVDCAPLSAEECTFETQLAGDIARTEALAALGLASIAGGLGLLHRRRRAAR